MAHLGLSDAAGNPRVLPVTYAMYGGALWSAVDDKPKRSHGEHVARVRWLRARPEFALTVDHYEDDWTRLAWVQVLGRATVLDPAGNADVMEALTARYPTYRAQPPRGPLLRLAPERAICWRAQDST